MANMMTPVSDNKSEVAVTTVKEVMQARVAEARKKLEEALMTQVKAEVLGVNDWPFDDLSKIVYHPF